MRQNSLLTLLVGLNTTLANVRCSIAYTGVTASLVDSTVDMAEALNRIGGTLLKLQGDLKLFTDISVNPADVASLVVELGEDPIQTVAEALELYDSARAELAVIATLITPSTVMH